MFLWLFVILAVCSAAAMLLSLLVPNEVNWPTKWLGKDNISGDCLHSGKKAKYVGVYGHGTSGPVITASRGLSEEN